MRTFLLFLLISVCAHAEPATIRVLVALADNKTQGILPVPEKIGNGDDAARNLYWGCDEALPMLLRKSAVWKAQPAVASPKDAILERKTYLHSSGKWRLIVDGYRGSAIRECTQDLFALLASDESLESLPLVIYAGHNGLMDFTLPEAATAKRGPGRQAMVFCCKSAQLFAPLLQAVDAKPVVLTTELMYPGGFLLIASLEGWIRKESPAQIRNRAASAYARNQGISTKAAAAIFATGL